MPAKSIKGLFYLLLFQLLTLFFIPQILLAREIVIDDTLKVELVNNEMSYEDSVRVFNYVKSTFYDHEDYYTAEKGFQKIVDFASSGKESRNFLKRICLKLTGKGYNDFSIKDDALYYIGKCQYHKGEYKYLLTFEQVYHLFPDGSVVKSGQLQDTLLSILEKKTHTSFNWTMRIHKFLSDVFPERAPVNELINFLEEEFPDFDHMLQIYRFLAKKYPERITVAEAALKAKTKKEVVFKEVNEEKLDNWRGYVASTNVAIDAREWTRRRILLYSRLMAKKAWNHFTKYPLTDKQLSRIEKMVNDRISFSNFEALGGNEFYPHPHTMKCEVSLKFSFRDLLEGTGIDLFDIGEEEKADDI